MRETHVPTQQSPAQAQARFPVANAFTRGTGHRQGAPFAGPVEAHRLIWRVRDRATFLGFRRARPCRRGPVTARAVCTADRDAPPRVAYTIGRSAGNAVERNRLRRRLRAAVHDEHDALHPGVAYLVGAQRGASELPFVELKSFVRDALTGAGSTSR
jgi:ribonuclease P protein component